MGVLAGPGEDGGHGIVCVAIVTEPVLPRGPPEEVVGRCPLMREVSQDGLDGLGGEAAAEAAEVVGVSKSGWFGEFVEQLVGKVVGGEWRFD